MLTNKKGCDIITHVARQKRHKSNGSIAQLGEHLPYKQRVIGSSPIVSTIGPVAQLVRALACHARGRGFEPHPSRHPICLCSSVGRAGDWKSPCRWFDSDRRHHFRGFSSFGRAPPCQGGGSEFEPRNPLQRTLKTKQFKRPLFKIEYGTIAKW